MDIANAAIFGVDDQGNVNQWNQNPAAIIGYQADEVLEKNMLKKLITKNYRESVNQVL
jgi:PAS domain S-box-containing protein